MVQRRAAAVRVREVHGGRLDGGTCSFTDLVVRCLTVE